MTDKEFYSKLYDLIGGKFPIPWNTKTILYYEFEILKEKGISKQKAAATMGIDNTLISKWLNLSDNRVPSSGNIKKLSEYLGVNPEYLQGKRYTRSSKRKNNDLSYSYSVSGLSFLQQRLLNLCGIRTYGFYPEGKETPVPIPRISKGQLFLFMGMDAPVLERGFRLNEDTDFAKINENSFNEVCEDILDYAHYKIEKYYKKQLENQNSLPSSANAIMDATLSNEELVELERQESIDEYLE